MPGKSISGYTLQRPLGTGGMAEVWYAENKIGKKAAVKLLLPKLCQDESLTSRFLTEAKVMVELSHPNIRQVYDYGDIEGRPAIVMEYLDGEDLKARMKRGQRFTEEELKRWWNQLVDALNYTHRQGIIHRDIKPSNIFVDKEGNVKLLDFGIAKNNEGGSGTMTGSTLGTRIYMSPEQVKDPKRVGAATDAYSLAVTFVHLLTRKAPYDITTISDFDIQVSIVNQPLDLSGVPDYWRQILTPYLEKDASKRPTLKHIGEPVNGNSQPSSIPDDDSTQLDGVKRNNVIPDSSHVLETSTTTEKRKNSVVPWIIAAVACAACVALALFPLKGGGDSNKADDENADKSKKADMGFVANVNDGVQSTNITLSNQINQRYAAFEDMYSVEQEKVGPYWDAAKALREEASDLINYTESLKWNLVQLVEKDPYATLKNIDTVLNGRKCFDIDINSMKSGSDSKKASSFMMNNGVASQLASKTGHFRGEVLKIMGTEFADEIGLNSDGNLGKGTFENKTLAEDVTALNQIVSDVQTSELNAITHLLGQIHAADYTFDEIGAKVFAESGYLLSGQTYKAQAMVTAWQNSQAKAYVRLDGGPEKEYISDAQGVINLNFNCGVGTHKYNGFIEMFNPATNKTEEFPFENQFTVSPPAVSVSATKMNVVYRGINNPIVVGGGVGGALRASASSGTLTSTGTGTYNFLPGTENEANINVSSDGSNLGSMRFRVKDLPKPTPVIRNVVNGHVSKSALLAAGRIEAEMKDFDLDGVRYDVVGYTMIYKTKAGTEKECKVTGAAFTDEMKNAINASNVGDMLVFTAIQVKGNDGKVKTLDMPIGIVIK